MKAQVPKPKKTTYCVVEIQGDEGSPPWEKVLYSCKNLPVAEKHAKQKRKEFVKAGKDPETILVRMI